MTSAIRGKALWALLWLALAGLCILGVGRNLWTPDEPREAEIGREMYLAPGMIPTLNGTAFYEKPPLYYWALATAYVAGGGPSPAAARAVSAVSCFLILVVTFAWARRARSAFTGLVAILLLATSGIFFMATHWIRLDPMLALFVTLAFWCAWEAIEGAGGWSVAGLYAAIVLSLWTKGLVGPALVVAGLLVWCLVDRARRPWSALRPALGAMVLLAGVASVGAGFYLAGGSDAFREWFWVNHVLRVVHPQATGHEHGVAYYFIGPLPMAVFPWLAPAIDLLRRPFWAAGARDRRLKLFCASLFLGGLIVLTLSSSKRETYLLPLLPPLGLLAALAAAERIEAARVGVLAWINAIVIALLGVGPAAAVVAYTRAARPATVILGLAGAGAAFAMFAHLARRRVGPASAWAATAAAISCAGLLLLVMPVIDQTKGMEPFVGWLDTQIPPGEPVYALGADETLRGIVPFTTGRRLVTLTPEDLQPRETGNPELPRLLLCQVVGRHRMQEAVTQAYTKVRDDAIGPGRTLSLWRLKPAPGA